MGAGVRHAGARECGRGARGGAPEDVTVAVGKTRGIGTGLTRGGRDGRTHPAGHAIFAPGMEGKTTSSLLATALACSCPVAFMGVHTHTGPGGAVKR